MNEEAIMAQTTRTFRIFVSSTFSDLKEERNALQRDVFPRLRELCAAHGCRFQAIDLRWGVREEAGLDQQTMRICLDEISRSQRASPRPNFIVLLGDRYGWRPLPAEIPAGEFEEIERRVINADDKALLARWYKRDDNAVPAVYALQPRRDEFADFESWEQRAERPLRRILLGAIAGMPVGPDEKLKYESSATEQEIAAGALKVLDAQDHVFCFFRKITNLDELIKRLPASETVKAFVDTRDDGSSDAEAHARLESLKATLGSRLPRNTHEYEARSASDHISYDHISALCDDVFQSLSRVIEEEIARMTSVDALEKEVADHEAFARDRAKLFIGRASILETIGDYISASSTSPLAVFGESGSGKSALMARAIEHARPELPASEVVYRFIGATPASSDGRALIESICREVSRRYAADEGDVPTDYKELEQELPKRLALATAARPLILFLDALDQLSDADSARNLVWLPAELPQHVRLVVSTLSGQSLSALERKLPESNLVKLEPMPAGEGRELLARWLENTGRALQPRQAEEVLTKFARSGLPLYLKLAFEEARRWKSYTTDINLSEDVPGVIRDLFARLSSDANHGRVVVSRGLAYLAASKNGLTEDELLDVLSRDEDVLADFKSRARHTPPEERLPVIVWSRLFFDIEPYLTERSADEASLMSFYHRQLREVVEAEYLSKEEKPKRHFALANYFASQELFEREKQTANVRKLSELPYQQTHAEMWDELHATLTDFDFLEAKCTHIAVTTTGQGDSARKIYGGVYELQEDYRRALEKFPAE
jgi:hypothetical protein